MMTNRRARIYVGLVIAAGAAILIQGLWDWRTDSWARYLFYCGLAMLASGMKVRLPAVKSAMSLNFVFVLIGIADLSFAETLLMGCLGMLVQCVFQTKTRPQAVRVAFSVASMAWSIAACYDVYHAPQLAARSVPMPAMLLLAAATFFVTNTLSVSGALALTGTRAIWDVWRETYFWSFPNYLVGAAVAWIISAASRSFGWQTALLLLPILYVIFRSHILYVTRLEEEKKRAEEQRNHAEEVAALHRRTIEALALAIEAKDQTTHDHLERVEVYAVEVGKELGLTPSELEAVRASALLHDIGKLAVPEYIISKPGKLTPEEFEKMKVHPVVGAEILERVRFPYAVAPIVRSHHEKWDGSGYPDGLAGEQIPIGARILSAVDCLDALASDRQYRRALPLEEAIRVVQAEAGKSFDPTVVEVLARRCVELELLAKSGSHGEKAKLSVDVKIERGAAPAAGFESSREVNHATSDLVNLQGSIADRNRTKDGLAALSQKLAESAGRTSVFDTLRDGLRELIPYSLLAVYQRHEERLVPEFLDGEDYRLFASLEIPLGMGLSGWVAENRKSIINGNPSVEPGYMNDPTKFSTLRSALAVPLEVRDSVIGVLSLYRRDRDAFTPEHLRMLRTLSETLARVLDGAVEAVAP